MATLIELSDTVTTTTCQLIVENYTKRFALCRKGLWVGVECLQSERLVLSYEHDPEELYVGWALDGVTVLDPGFGTWTPPWGEPVPGTSDVTYQTGVDGFSHRIALSVNPGAPHRSVLAQVLYRYPNNPYEAAHLGPTWLVELDGSSIHWPAALLEEERRCWDRIIDILRRYVEIAPVGPGDPVERAIERASTPEDLEVLAAALRVVELDHDKEADVVAAYRRTVTEVVRRLSIEPARGQAASD